MQILIVKLSSIGDVVHALPTLSALRKEFPQAEISWAVERRAAEILRGNPLLKNLIELDTRVLRDEKLSKIERLRELRRQTKQLRTENFDLAFDLQGLIKSAAIARLSRAPRRVGFAPNALREPHSRFLLTETRRVPLRANVIYKNLALAAETLNFPLPNAEQLEFPVFPDKTHLAEADELSAKLGANFAVLNVGGGWWTKLWRAENFGLLADEIYRKFGLISAVSYGPNEDELAERAVSASRLQTVFKISPSLRGFYALARRAKIYVGGDTGLTHLAVAARCPTVGIFGPTEWWRNGSPFKSDICVERTDIGCRENCHRRTCGSWICLDIGVEKVLQAVEQRLESERERRIARIS